jgi:hypothetical protein
VTALSCGASSGLDPKVANPKVDQKRAHNIDTRYSAKLQNDIMTFDTFQPNEVTTLEPTSSPSSPSSPS